MNNDNKRCKHCGQDLIFENDRGWIHLEGGTYMMVCKDCEYKAALYPSPPICPACGGNNWVDDHCVLPIT